MHLENIIAIQFEIGYEDNVLELNIDNCNSENNIDCHIANSTLSYLTNTSNPGIIEGIIYSGMFFAIEDEFINIKFKVIGSLGDYSEININRFEINDIDIVGYSQEGTVTIGNFGCIDDGNCTEATCGFDSPTPGVSACNYNIEAQFDDGSCAYEYDCTGECGGVAIIDCMGECSGLAVEDCAGICNGSTLIDDCGKCDGIMFPNQDGEYPNGTCDCNGTLPNIYCIDNDGDGLGDPDNSITSCVDINQQELVLDCNDNNDECDGMLDNCGVCNGGNTDQDCTGECFGNAALDCLGVCEGTAIEDECGECNGVMFVDNNGFYPDATCDCDGTQPNSYCTDSNQDGISDYEPLLFCGQPPSDNFIDCQTLNLDKQIPNELQLLSAYPNPFNPSVSIEYIIDNANYINIDILDLNGRLIKKIFSAIQIPGKHSIIWTPEIHIVSGIYLVRLKYDDKIFVQKLNYIK